MTNSQVIRRRPDIHAALLLLAAGLLVYWKGLAGGFIFDDFANLLDNPTWKLTSLAPEAIARAAAPGISSDFGRPLAMFSFALNHYFTGIDPFWLKLTNLAMHLANGILVFLLCRELMAAIGNGVPQRGKDKRVLVPALIALAWVVHPLQVSTVLYVVQRMEIGAHTSVLVALLLYLAARRRQEEARVAWPLLAGSAIAVLAGLGFKETAILAPSYAFVLELAVFRFRTAGGRASRWLAGTYAAGALLALAVYLSVVVPTYFNEVAYAFRDYSASERLVTQVHVLWMYLGQAFLPLPSKLVFYYDNFPTSFPLHVTLAKALALGGLVLLALRVLRSRPFFAIGVLWFFFAHSLTSNILPLELAFEHRNYFALLGLLLAAADALGWLLRGLTPEVRTLMAAVAIAFLGFIAWIQASTWSDPLRLANTLASTNPGSARASYDLALNMLRTAGRDYDAPLVSIALKELQHASTLPGSSPLAEQAILSVEARRGTGRQDEAWQRLRAKLARRAAGPEEVAALHGLVSCSLAPECRLDAQELLNTFLVAVERNPDNPEILSLYANFAFSVLGDAELAVRLAEEAIELDPAELQYRANLGRILHASGHDPAKLARLVAEVGRLDSRKEFHGEAFLQEGPASDHAELPDPSILEPTK